jgi:hypothetical protein
MECVQCKVHMVDMWKEPLGLMARCPCCLEIVVLPYDRRKTDRCVEGDQAA